MMPETRAAAIGPPPLHGLTTQQRRIVETIDSYQRATGEACPASYLARRLRVHHSTMQDHFIALHRKGWLRAPTGPAVLVIALE
jgi:Mn-dependent DtxR family transcriptional regulator